MSMLNKAYREVQASTSEGEEAYIELYGRIIDWTHELGRIFSAGSSGSELAEKCRRLVLSMNALINPDARSDIPNRLNLLHNWLAEELVAADRERSQEKLDGIRKVLIEMIGIFEALRARRAMGRSEALTENSDTGKT